MSEQSLNVKFVQEVEKFPCLYNYKLPQYSRKDITEAAWNKIGKEMNMTVFVRHMKPAPSGSAAKKKQYYLTDVMQFVLPFVKSGIPLQASNLPDRNTMLLEEETETFEEPTLREDTEVPLTETSDYQPYNPLFQTEQTSTETTPVSTEVPQPQSSSTLHTMVNKRKRPLDEVDKNFIAFLKARQTQRENTRQMFLLSLLDEVSSMCDQQWKLFKKRTLNVIDDIMTPARTYINQFEGDSPSYSNNSQLSFPSDNNQTDTY
ncbi:hypothetical protein FQR65_LT17964 [Abscondita terminalis]|nr:hypothetical protein FQR65_LT17964 [Abscondita terminalis]